MPDTGKPIWVAQTSRERKIVQDLNDAHRELEHFKHEVFRLKAQLKMATRGHQLSEAPKQRGEVLRPGAVGYITHVELTAQGRSALEFDVGLTLADMLILGVVNSVEGGKITFDRIAAFIPKNIADSAKVISYTHLMGVRGLLDVTFEKIVPE